MALPLFNDCDSQPDGTTVTTGNSGGNSQADAFNSVVIGANMTCQYSNGVLPAQGNTAIKMALTSTATAITYVAWNSTSIGSAVVDLRLRWWYYCTIIPVSGLRIVEFRKAGVRIAGVDMESGGGTISCRSAADATVGTTSSVIPLSTWMRFELDLHCNASTGTMTINCYKGFDNTGLATPASCTAQNFSTGCDEVRIGATTANFSSTAGNFWIIDGLHLTTNALPIGSDVSSHRVDNPIISQMYEPMDRRIYAN